MSATSTEAACQPDALPFVLRVPLNVVNLPAGEYVVDANGTRATFTLETGTRAASVTSIATPEAGAAPSLREAQIDHVNIVMGMGSPRPVHVIISGSLPDSCAQLGEIQLRRVGTTGAGFHIGVMTHSEAGEGCVADSPPFRLEFPLNIVNLPEGPYNVSVNGVTAGFDPRTTPAPSGHAAQIESVEVQVRASLPLEVVAIVRGLLPDAGCTTIASVMQAREGNTLRLTLTTTTDTETARPCSSPFRILSALIRPACSARRWTWPRRCSAQAGVQMDRARRCSSSPAGQMARCSGTVC